jgi:hypothetical protein
VIGAGAVFVSGCVSRTSGVRKKQARPVPRHRTRHSAGTTTTTPPKPTTTQPQSGLLKWSDPATWGGKVPGQGDLATIDKPVLLDVDTQVHGVKIGVAGQLVFDPDKSHTLTSTANVVVKGALRMRPKSVAVHHLLAFAGIDEGNFEGGDTHMVMDSDVGLWIVESGILDAVGAEKTAWTNLTAAANAGAASITVDAADGWQVGDEIVVTPTEAFDYGDHYQHHDRRVVTGVSGTQVKLDKPLDHNHPFVTLRAGLTHRPEVLNLGRNVRIEGQPDARAHVIQLHGMKPQTISWVGLRHLGPTGVLGRYALHFHMCEDGTRGTKVDGVVAYDIDNHGFVPHLSHGVTFTDCIVHQGRRQAFWWDEAGAGQQSGDVPSHNTVYDHCVASRIDYGSGDGEPHSNAGFFMGAGKGSIARKCVAVGVAGRSEGATGFQWSAGSNDEKNPWIFEDNLSHNNTHSGLFYWQNNAPKTIVDRFHVYNCAQGLYAGSYINLVSYRDCVAYGCEEYGLNVRATPSGVGGGQTITYDGMYIDQAGHGDFGVLIQEHTLSDDVVTKFTGCTFKGAKKAQIGFPSGGDLRQMYDFVDCTFDGNAFWIAEGVPANSQIRVQGGNLGSIMVHPPGGPGTAKPQWNGSVTAA